MSRRAAAAAVARLADNGHQPAAAMIDSAFSSDGIFDLPPGYLTAIADAVRAAGGLFIADEVQAGLGRVGDRFWGFAVDGFVPDLVTLGKPIGNGFPMGAVITTPAIAERFAASDYFFSTFGGSPVAAAAGLAVLDVTRDEGLPARAEAIGAGLRRDLAAALAAHGVPGTVRGAGLFIGVDVGEPAPRPRAGRGPEGAARARLDHRPAAERAEDPAAARLRRDPCRPAARGLRGGARAPGDRADACGSSLPRSVGDAWDVEAEVMCQASPHRGPDLLRRHDPERR